jgi:hypothetical protein
MHKFMAVVLLLLSSPVFAGSYQDEIDKFFLAYEAGKISEAVDGLYQTNQWINPVGDEVVQVKSQLSSLQSLVGKNMGKELIATNNVKGRFVQVTYMLLYERQPVRAEFQFYKPKNDWVIYSFGFDTDFDDDIKAVARSQAASGKGI